MFDTLAVAQEMTAGGVDRDEAETIAGAMRKAIDEHDHVTTGQFTAGVAEIRRELAKMDKRISEVDKRLSTQIADLHTAIAKMEARLIRWMVGTVIAAAAATAGLFRLFGG